MSDQTPAPRKTAAKPKRRRAKPATTVQLVHPAAPRRVRDVGPATEATYRRNGWVDATATPSSDA